MLDNDKNVIYTELTTNQDGQIVIDNLLPGTYYIRETRSIEGYEIYNKLIKVELDLNEESKVNVINSKEEPNIEIDKKKTENTVKSNESKIEVKLPKTGM